jgi:hypothetical protein
MRTKLLLASFAALLVITIAAPLSAGADPVYNIEGFVADTNGDAMEGVEVSILDGSSVTFKAYTDANGFFSVRVSSNTNLQISFAAHGHTLLTCPNTSVQQGKEYLALNLSKAAYNSSTGTYTITGSIKDMQCAIMIISNGVVKGSVTCGGNPVRNATVTLTPEGKGASESRSTDSNGHYEMTVPTGVYTLTVTGQGVKDSVPVQITLTGAGTTVNVQMEKSDLKKYLGLDLAHLLMLVGVIVGMILAIAAWYMSKRLSRPHGLEIIDDSLIENDELRFS